MNMCNMVLTEKLCLLIVITILNISPLCYGEVKYIQAIIRHADRNPLSKNVADLCYPNDPYKDYDWAPDGAMELTNTGKFNAYKLGQFLRKKYELLIGSTYKSSRVYFHASQMNRARNTAQLVAAGLFPPLGSQIWNSKLLWIPIPIHFAPMDRDILNYAMGFCGNYRRDRIKFEADVTRLFKVVSDIQTTFEYLSNNTGVEHTRCVQGWILYHQLAAQAGRHLKLETWTETVFPNGKLVDISAVEYILQTYTQRMKRLVGGVWIKLFLDYIDNLITGENNQLRASFYVNNEIQIAALLNTLGVYKPHVPGYTSAVIFELHAIEKRLYVQVIYRNEEMVEELIIPGCKSSICLLSTFKNVLKNVTLQNFEEDCGDRVNFSII